MEACRSPDGDAPNAPARALQPGQYCFGPFLLDTARSILIEDGRQVRLGSRAMSMLAVLVEAEGELVTRRELVERAWPQTFVEASNLRVQMSALRRALGDNGESPRYVLNVPGLGYRFGEPVARGGSYAPIDPTQLSRQISAPAAVAEVVGRDREIRSVVRAVARARLVTVTGPGGVGKTTIAAAAIRLLGEQRTTETCFVDLAAVESPTLVVAAVAAALGLDPSSENTIAYVIKAIGELRLTLVLDSCEHLLAAATDLCEAILRACPNVSILATSHEALRLPGERVIRAGTLAVPDAAATLEEALRSPAVELLIARARAAQPSLELTDADAATICAICSRLDGVPLAIEIAAANLDILSLGELLGRLDGHLGLTMSNRRTASARHQTIRAMLDWSTRELGAGDRQTLLWVAREDHPLDLLVIEDAAAAGSIARLIRRSLLLPSRQDGRLVYRMLQITRSYVTESFAGPAS